MGGKETQWRAQWTGEQRLSVAGSFFSPPCGILWAHPVPSMKRLRISLHLRPPALSPTCPSSRGALDGYSLSMSLYFFLSMDTWSLNRTGSSLICEWTRGMLPNQLANLFMQVWRWAKWSGSAQRDARELWGWGGGGWMQRERKKERDTTINSLWIQYDADLLRPPVLPTAIMEENKWLYLSHHRLFVLFLLSDLYGW